MKKRVYIVNSHHHVLKEWINHRKDGVHLLSFDYHTDFFVAFLRKMWDSETSSCSTARRNLYLKKHIPCSNVDAAIDDLRNDEHIDFALKSGMIERAFVFSCCRNTVLGGRVFSVPPKREKIGRAKIVSYSEKNCSLENSCNEKLMAKYVTTDGVLNEVMQVFRQQGFNNDNYILDFDCDFIRSKMAMEHNHLETFKGLIKGAKAITIARESKYVRLCSNRKLRSKTIEDWLVALINSVCEVELIRETIE